MSLSLRCMGKNEIRYIACVCTVIETSAFPLYLTIFYAKKNAHILKIYGRRYEYDLSYLDLM